nr:MAG TPA: hypothetical protein [Caudoviricetes sp.]
MRTISGLLQCRCFQHSGDNILVSARLSQKNY